MSRYSSGILAVRVLAEIEAKAGNFEAILPDHLLMGLCKIVDLQEESVADMLKGKNPSEELAELKAWFASKQIDPTQFRRKLRELLGTGTGTKARLHRSPESVALFEAAARLAIKEGGEVVRMVHLARAITEQPKPSTEGIVFTTMKPASRRTVALLVLDLVQSTQLVLNVGDTAFNTIIGNIHKRFKQHDSAAAMVFLKCTGDGFLSVFTTVPAACTLASTFLTMPVHPDVHVRMALHWGTVKTGPDGDVLGREVHLVCRVEGVKSDNQVAPVPSEHPLPEFDRVLITRQSLERLEASAQAQFKPAGKFRLKGFDEPYELWVYSFRTPDKSL